MMDQQLILNDGTVLNDSSIITMSDYIIIYCYAGLSFSQAYELFSDKECTVEIKGIAYGEETVYNGFTELFALRKENELMITACLRKESE